MAGESWDLKRVRWWFDRRNLRDEVEMTGEILQAENWRGHVDRSASWTGSRFHTHTNMVWSASWLRFCCCVKMSWSLLRLALYCSNSVLLQVSICLYIKVICHQPLMRSIFNRSIFSWWKSQLTSITLIISILFICSVLTRVFIILLEISILSLNVYILSQILDNVKLWYDIILSFPGFKGCITVKRCPFLNQIVLGQFFFVLFFSCICRRVLTHVGNVGSLWIHWFKSVV